MKLATKVAGDPKAPFSIATTPRYKGGRYSFPGIAPLTLDPYFILLSVKKEVSSTIFCVFIMIRPGIEPQSLGSLANTLPTNIIYITTLLHEQDTTQDHF